MKLAMPSFKGKFGRSSAPATPADSSTKISGVFAQSNAREAWWQLDQQFQLCTSEADADPRAGGKETYLSFSSKDDFCIPVDKNLRAQVRDLMSDVGEPIFTQRIQSGPSAPDQSLLGQKITGPWLYGTTQARMSSLPADVNLVPGQAALRALLSRRDVLSNIEAPFVTGILFGGTQGAQVLILMVCTHSGELSDIDYTPLAGTQPTEAVRAFVQSVRLSSSGEWTQERTAIFSSADLNGIDLKPYPKESEVLGVPASTLWKQAAVVSGVALLCTAGATASLELVNRQAKADTQKALAQQKRTEADIAKALAGPKLGSVLDQRTVDVKSAINKATEIWQDGALVTFNATSDTVSLTVSHKIQAPEQSPAMLAKALRVVPPAGCTRESPSTTTQLTELYLTYECKSPDSPIQRLSSSAR